MDNSSDPRYHPNLYILAIERTGWRRYIFGRWVYNSEPFRRDIQRRCGKANIQIFRPSHTTLGPEWEAAQATAPEQEDKNEHNG